MLCILLHKIIFCEIVFTPRQIPKNISFSQWAPPRLVDLKITSKKVSALTLSYQCGKVDPTTSL